MLLITWSIRLSLALFVAVLLWRLLGPQAANPQRWLKILWSIGFVLFVAHVLAAFHFVHHWSHEEAYRATARQTRELIGVAYGQGVYFNHLFMLAWAFDVWAMWSMSKGQPPSIRTLQRLALVYMLFIAFNGVVVFKAGWLRGVGIVATALLAIALVFKASAHRINSKDVLSDKR